MANIGPSKRKTIIVKPHSEPIPSKIEPPKIAPAPAKKDPELVPA